MPRYCKTENCTTHPTYGKEGSKIAEYCKKHKLRGYVDVVHKKCKHENCTTQPTYGKEGSKIAEYCQEHAQTYPGYVDVLNKKCKHENCTTQPTYGKEGSKTAEYCQEHAQTHPSYVDVVHKKCKHENCTTRANYGNIGFCEEYCNNHKKKGMVRNPRKRCNKCKEFASYVYNSTFYCLEHSTKESIDIGNCCVMCFSVFVDEKGMLCDGCTKFSEDGKTVKKKMKELAIKTLLEENKISVESHDSVIKGSCSTLRPDFLIPSFWGHIVLEIDEHQHNRKSYPCECEIQRMKRIYFDIGTEKVLYIRYNPDKYVPSHGKEFLESMRHDYLISKIEEYMQKEPAQACTVMYFFYDGFSELEVEEEVIYPYEFQDFYECELCSMYIQLENIKNHCCS